MSRTRLMQNLSGLLRKAILQERCQLTDASLQDCHEQVRNAISRRRFILQTGWGGVALSQLAACQTPGASLNAAALPRDIAIVGAGTAGLTAAYYLAKEGLGSIVYEGSSRLGGRMFTADKFNKDGMFCELGGEFIDTGHEDLIQLCGELGLVIEDLKSEKSQQQEIYFSRNKIRTEKQIIAAFKPLAARLIKDIEAVSVKGELQVPTYNSDLAQSPRVKALDFMSLAEYLASAGMDAWLVDLIGNAYVGEYGLELAQQSALNLIVLISPQTHDHFKIFGESDEAKRIQGGNQALPNALARTVGSANPLEFEHKLLAIRDQNNRFQLVFDQKGKTVEVVCQRLILAIPPPLLRDVDMKNLQLSPTKRRAIESWSLGDNSKLMLGFQKRAWEKDPRLQGFSLLPDQVAQEFWDTSRGQKGARGIVTCFLGGEAGRLVDPQQQTRSLQFLDQIFPGTKAAFEGTHRLMHWPSHPFSRGSYTCSKPGDYTTIYGAFAESELNGRLIFAGEHCSQDWSGYMNGAVQSGRQAADILVGRSQTGEQ